MKYEITSLNTKKTLAASLKKIMRTKSFSKITVSELVADCGLNRKTFYYHFEDIYALLKWIFENETGEIVKQFDLGVDYEEIIRFVMNYVEENDYIIHCACDSIGRDEMKRFFYTNFVGVAMAVIEEAEEKYDIKRDPELKVYAAKFYTEAIAGMLLDWISEKDRSDREKVIGHMTTLIEIALQSMRLYLPK